MANGTKGRSHAPDEPLSGLADHFATPAQQFESGKLGMWLFLATEVLLFGGLFCAYAVYRASHPEVFSAGHKYLDKTLGAVNTIILICSSLTMAWAVHCAQRSQRGGLILLLALTLACGCGFLGIKYVEYEHKWKHGLRWGKQFKPDLDTPADSYEHLRPLSGAAAGPAPSGHAALSSVTRPAEQGVATSPAGSGEPPQKPLATRTATTNATRPVATSGAPVSEERSLITPAPSGPKGLALAPELTVRREKDQVQNVHLFFGIYFAMTGLHAVHVIAGMIVLAWLLTCSVKGHFGSAYFTPVDLGGLYWHLVDVIWIFLFPLLYLIH